MLSLIRKEVFYIICKGCTFFLGALFYFHQASHLTLAWSFPDISNWGILHQEEASLIPPFASCLFCHMQLWHTGTFWSKRMQRKFQEANTLFLTSLKFRFALRKWVALSNFSSNLTFILNAFFLWPFSHVMTAM